MKKSIALMSMVLCLSAFGDEAGITNVVVRQRWPWSGKVDIDFTVTGAPTYVKFVAQHDGASPFVLNEKDLSGCFGGLLQCGVHSVTWDPVRAGMDKSKLKKFKITVEVDNTDKTYLILDLHDGSYVYAAHPPDEGWLADDSVYYRNKMVFRRVPLGTFVQGYSSDIINWLNFGSYNGMMGARKMTISSDFYLAVFKTTIAQHHCVTNSAEGKIVDVSSMGKEIVTTMSYNKLRGATSAVESVNVNWPHTGYKVAPGSVVDCYKRLTANSFPVDWEIDLPTVSQWTRASRAEIEDGMIWEIGGQYGDPLTEMTNMASKVGLWKINKNNYTSGALGQFPANSWGFYDLCGLAFEWGLDWYGWVGGTTDCVGKTENSKGYRSRLGCYADGAHLCWMVPGFVYSYSSNTEKCGYRMCIHLNRLKTGAKR